MGIDRILSEGNIRGSRVNYFFTSALLISEFTGAGPHGLVSRKKKNQQISEKQQQSPKVAKDAVTNLGKVWVKYQSPL